MSSAGSPAGSVFALWLVMCGVVLGPPLVVLGNGLVSTLIFGVTPYDGVPVLVAVVILLGIGTAGGIVPAPARGTS